MKLLLLITVICVFAPLVSAGVIVNLHQSIEDGLVSCKNTSAPGDLQVQENVHVEPQFFAVVETSITIPGEGFFSKPISCILVIIAVYSNIYGFRAEGITTLTRSDEIISILYDSQLFLV
nr:unnamed protein product [Callosobruchus chinensis]